MRKQILFYTILSLFLNGCVSERLEPKINFNTKPKLQKTHNKTQTKQAVNNSGSLFRHSSNLYSSNSKTLEIGDIIQINISENIKAGSIGERKTNKANNTDLGGGVVTPLASADITPYTGVRRLTDQVNSAINIGFNTKTTNSFIGKTSAIHDEKFTATISAVIQQKYPNGNYLIYGEKEILIDGQLQVIRISGVVRPYDIKLPDHSVPSSKLANAKIMYKKQGVEHDSTVKPWGTTVIENVWPF